MLDKIQAKFHSIYGFRISVWGSIYLGQSKNPVINLYFKSTLSLEILIKIFTTSAAAQNTQLAQHTGRTRQIYFWLACIYCLHKYNGHRKKDLQFAFPLYISHTIQLLSGNTATDLISYHIMLFPQQLFSIRLLLPNQTDPKASLLLP